MFNGRFKYFCYILFSVAFQEVLLALPEVPEVVSGQAEISYSDSSTMIIEAGHRAILNYQDFQIAQGERVQFVQPSSSSSVLNRIVGENASSIFGRLESNGKVWSRKSLA